LEVRHDPADGGVHHIDGGDIGAVLSVGALRGRCRAVEHVLRVAHAILRRLELSAEGSRVLKLLHAAVLFGVTDGARVWWIAVSRKHVVAFGGVCGISISSGRGSRLFSHLYIVFPI